MLAGIFDSRKKTYCFVDMESILQQCFPETFASHASVTSPMAPLHILLAHFQLRFNDVHCLFIVFKTLFFSIYSYCKDSITRLPKTVTF
jgi:hypothetical protein